jgi:hypothetical protein
LNLTFKNVKTKVELIFEVIFARTSPAMSNSVRLAVALLGIAPLTSSCSSASESPDAGAPSEFIAYASSFDGFHSWSSANATTADDAGDGLHGLGPLRVYWNQKPPHGSTSFPVGTIIVKESEQTDVTQRTVFAMVKRGGGYNASGAAGWEWYSLLDNADGSVTILWNLTAPPPGETYANQAIGDCNGCHGVVKDNDYVWDTALQLSSF